MTEYNKYVEKNESDVQGTTGDATNAYNSHYLRKMQPIEFIQRYDLGFEMGNFVKYIVRAGYKEGESLTKDIEKAENYLNSHFYEYIKIIYTSINPNFFCSPYFYIKDIEKLLTDKNGVQDKYYDYKYSILKSLYLYIILVNTIYNKTDSEIAYDIYYKLSECVKDFRYYASVGNLLDSDGDKGREVVDIDTETYDNPVISKKFQTLTYHASLNISPIKVPMVIGTYYTIDTDSSDDFFTKYKDFDEFVVEKSVFIPPYYINVPTLMYPIYYPYTNSLYLCKGEDDAIYDLASSFNNQELLDEIEKLSKNGRDFIKVNVATGMFEYEGKEYFLLSSDVDLLTKSYKKVNEDNLVFCNSIIKTRLLNENDNVLNASVTFALDMDQEECGIDRWRYLIALDSFHVRTNFIFGNHKEHDSIRLKLKDYAVLRDCLGTNIYGEDYNCTLLVSENRDLYAKLRKLFDIDESIE